MLNETIKEYKARFNEAKEELIKEQLKKIEMQAPGVSREVIDKLENQIKDYA